MAVSETVWGGLETVMETVKETVMDGLETALGSWDSWDGTFHVGAPTFAVADEPLPDTTNDTVDEACLKKVNFDGINYNQNGKYNGQPYYVSENGIEKICHYYDQIIENGYWAVMPNYDPLVKGCEVECGVHNIGFSDPTKTCPVGVQMRSVVDDQWVSNLIIEEGHTNFTQTVCNKGNEHFAECGNECMDHWSSCKDPMAEIECGNLPCQKRCMCDQGYKRDWVDGICKPCKGPDTEPECGENEEYTDCGNGCMDGWGNCVVPITQAYMECGQPGSYCKKGCFCKDGYVRNFVTKKCEKCDNVPGPPIELTSEPNNSTTRPTTINPEEWCKKQSPITIHVGNRGKIKRHGPDSYIVRVKVNKT